LQPLFQQLHISIKKIHTIVKEATYMFRPFLGFASPCVIKLSTESTNQMQEILKFINFYLNTAKHVSGILISIIRRSTIAFAASGFTFGTWW
jgi:hypothetical protein